MTANSLVGLLAAADRRRVFAAIVLGASTAADVTSRTSLTTRAATVALRKLIDGGLVERAVDGSLGVREAAFTEAVKQRGAVGSGGAAGSGGADGYEGLPSSQAAVLRAFVVDGRLSAIPAARGKRRVVLEHLVLTFEPGVRYSEREVNAVLRAWHPDFAALRRYLIDEELMARDKGVYWRIGGPVPVC